MSFDELTKKYNFHFGKIKRCMELIRETVESKVPKDRLALKVVRITLEFTISISSVLPLLVEDMKTMDKGKNAEYIKECVTFGIMNFLDESFKDLNKMSKTLNETQDDEEIWFTLRPLIKLSIYRYFSNDGKTSRCCVML
uniref:Uncharacterized protein n=1 Tax=Pithovirus LCDPAC01 TaxID=2506600 RepID=A0A481YN36_9VIRU|nr:MAG: hypothetical protein LCDPAC01_02210 [Pithovirus LCDPAC01]